MAARLPADGDDPAVRRAGQRSLHARADARARASLQRRRGRCRGDLRCAARRRLHHQHASRPRALPGQRRFARPHVRGVARQGSRDIAAAKADRCTSPIQRPAIWARTRSSAAASGIATGAAFSAKRLGNGRVAVCFFGEGALGQGSLYEVMNLAQLWKLPVIYVCENNLYNEYTHFSETTAGTILGRAAAFGIEARAWTARTCAPCMR